MDLTLSAAVSSKASDCKYKPGNLSPFLCNEVIDRAFWGDPMGHRHRTTRAMPQGTIIPT